jgi:hypothetical protein
MTSFTAHYSLADSGLVEVVTVAGMSKGVSLHCSGAIVVDGQPHVALLMTYSALKDLGFTGTEAIHIMNLFNSSFT